MLYGALMSEPCSPSGEECFVTGKFGNVSCRFAGERKGGDAETGVLGGMIVRVSLGELRAEVLDFLFRQLEGTLRLSMFFLLTSKCLCAFCTP